MKINLNIIKTVIILSVIVAGVILITSCRQSVVDPINLDKGPHLFIDDYLIAEQSFLSRSVNNPEKYPEPVITGGENGDQNFQPYLSVIRDETTGLFRMWYNTPVTRSQTHIGYIESNDGINWIRPHRLLCDPQEIKYNVSVIDRGILFEKPEHRFVMGFYHDDGMKIAVSPDGFEWEMLTDKTVVKHGQDVNSMHWDPIRKQYLMIAQLKLKMKPEWEGIRRIPHQTVSKDLLNWEPLKPIIMPKVCADIEQGETQFYAMSGVIARGDLLIGLVKVLRDDLNATPGKTAKEMGDMRRKAAGIGYTVLAWSRDGETWQRDHQPFLNRNMLPDTWDHAMAWGDEQIIVDDETYVYYAGYKRGHKVNRFTDRCIGLAKMPIDRYVSRDAELNEGTLITKPVTLSAEAMTVNANIQGEIKIRILDANRNPIDGFEAVSLKGDSVNHKVEWQNALNTLDGETVCIEFKVNNAQLFGFNLH